MKVVGVEQPIALRARRDVRSRFGCRLRRELARAEPDDKASAIGRALTPGTHKIEFIVQAVDDEKVVRHEKSSFIVPR